MYHHTSLLELRPKKKQCSSYTLTGPENWFAVPCPVGWKGASMLQTAFNALWQHEKLLWYPAWYFQRWESCWGRTGRGGGGLREVTKDGQVRSTRSGHILAVALLHWAVTGHPPSLDRSPPTVSRSQTGDSSCVLIVRYRYSIPLVTT